MEENEKEQNRNSILKADNGRLSRLHEENEMKIDEQERTKQQNKEILQQQNQEKVQNQKEIGAMEAYYISLIKESGKKIKSEEEAEEAAKSKGEFESKVTKWLIEEKIIKSQKEAAKAKYGTEKKQKITPEMQDRELYDEAKVKEKSDKEQETSKKKRDEILEELTYKLKMLEERLKKAQQLSPFCGSPSQVDAARTLSWMSWSGSGAKLQ